jgi:hypothetical protein
MTVLKKDAEKESGFLIESYQDYLPIWIPHVPCTKKRSRQRNQEILTLFPPCKENKSFQKRQQIKNQLYET